MKKDLKELISYVFVGGCTTLINFVIYWFVITMMDQGWLFANVISWVGAVIFAFWANKHFVFKSANETGKEAYQLKADYYLFLFSYYLQMRCYQK